MEEFFTDALSAVAPFARPVFAALLGAGIGAFALLSTHAGVRSMTPEQPTSGVVRTLLMMGVGMGAALLALVACFVWAKDMLVFFGIALIVGFIVPAVVVFVRLSDMVGASSQGGR